MNVPAGQGLHWFLDVAPCATPYYPSGHFLQTFCFTPS